MKIRKEKLNELTDNLKRLYFSYGLIKIRSLDGKKWGIVYFIYN